MGTGQDQHSTSTLTPHLQAMPRSTIQSPNGRSARSHLVSSGYDTRNLPNPFQDTTHSSASSSKHVTAPSSTAAPASAPVPSDTIATSASTASSYFSATKSMHNNQGKSGSGSSTTYPQQQPHQQQSRPSLRENSPQDQQQNTFVDDHEDQDPHGLHAPNQDDEHEQEQDQEQENPLIYLTAGQREAAVENLEIETMDRMQKLRASIGVLTSSLKFRSEAEINRLPAAVRTMTVEEYWFTYNGSAKEYLEQQAVKKSVANMSFLQALGITDHKKKREMIGQSDELLRQKHKTEDGIEKHPRYRPYPSASSSSTSQNQPHRHVLKPFVDSSFGLGSNKE